MRTMPLPVDRIAPGEEQGEQQQDRGNGTDEQSHGPDGSLGLGWERRSRRGRDVAGEGQCLTHGP